MPVRVGMAERARWKVEDSARQNRQRIFHLVPLPGECGGIGLGGGQFGLRWAMSNSLPIPPSKRPRVNCTCSCAIPPCWSPWRFRIQRAQGKIISRHVRLQGEQDIVVRGERGLGIGAGAFEAAPHPAPQVNLIAQIQGRGDVVAVMFEAGLLVG